MAREFKDWRKRRKRDLDSETLWRILKNTAVKDDAIETYKRLTGEDPPETDDREE